MIKKAFSFSIIFVLSALATLAQTTRDQIRARMIDSIKMAAISEYATRYPLLRQGVITTDFIGNRDIKGELLGNDLFEGKTNITRIRSNFNVPVASWGKNLITGTISYQQIHFDTKEIKSFHAEFPATDQSATKSTVGFTASFSRSDSLFNHQINYSGSVSGFTDELTSIKRFNYLGSVTVPVSRTRNHSWTVGMILIIDPSAVTPVLPVISYWHKFSKSDWDLYVDLPSRIVVRKQLTKRSWVFLGSELGGNLYFFDINKAPLPQHSIYSTIDLKTGATLEYMVTKKLVIGASGGIYTAARSRLTEKNGRIDDYFYRTSNGSAPYLSLSISFLPFLKR